MRLTHQQLRMVHTARRQLGLSEEAYRALLRDQAGVGSAKDLDGPGFEAVMAEMRRRGFRPNHGAAFLGERPGMATPRQVSWVRSLWREYTGRTDDQALDHWLHRYFKVSSLRFADRETAVKAIAALRRMTRRG